MEKRHAESRCDQFTECIHFEKSIKSAYKHITKQGGLKIQSALFFFNKYLVFDVVQTGDMPASKNIFKWLRK